MNKKVQLNKSDFESHLEVRWCPGCGDYSVLAAVQRYLASIGEPIEKHVFVSGIGCSSRFPYYMNTYGFHTIHGRAPAIAMGLTIARPDLSVWVVTGDGDLLSIGGNHFLHMLRRNPNIKVLLLNNQIYGLTKGQYSPTSTKGKVTKSSPAGSPDTPINPIQLALGAQATFVARVIDVDAQNLTEVLSEAYTHRGTALIEIYQNCNIFNDGAFDRIRGRDERAQYQLLLRHNAPLVFGRNSENGLIVENGRARAVEIGSNSSESVAKFGITTYDVTNFSLAMAMATIPQTDDACVPMGVFYKVDRPCIEDVLAEQLKDARKKAQLSSSAKDNLEELYLSGNTWTIR